MDPCFTERSAHLSRMASHSVRVDMSLLRRIQNSICLITAGKVARNKGTLCQHPACVICALSDSAADPYFTIARQFAHFSPQLSERYVDGPIDGISAELDGCADIQQIGISGIQFLPGGKRHIPLRIAGAHLAIVSAT